jgi:hypothetical protein
MKFLRYVESVRVAGWVDVAEKVCSSRNMYSLPEGGGSVEASYHGLGAMLPVCQPECNLWP